LSLDAWSGFIPHQPTPRQHAFLWLPDKEVMYGGAAGGGKSDALLMAGLQHVDQPAFAGLILRRRYADLTKPGALIDRSHQWLGPTQARWSPQTATWHFPSGAQLSFGYIATDRDLDQYQSAEYQYIGVDELTQFTLYQYRFMFSRLRRLEGSDIRLKMRSGTNPGNVGHEWVKERWRLGKRYAAEARPRGRRFVPARLEDNPHLDQDAYDSSLRELGGVLHAQLREGDWDVHNEGIKFNRSWFPIDEERGEPVTRVRYWDLASTEPAPGKDPDWTCGVLLAVDKEGVYHVEDVTRDRLTPLGVDRLVKRIAESDGRQVNVFMEQEPGSSGVRTIDHFRRTVLPGWQFRPHKTTGSKEVRANPVSSMAEAGNVHVVRGGWTEAFFDELEAFPNGEHDDQVDALSGAFLMLTSLNRWWVA